MDLASLHAFVEVAQTGSFSKASETLFITQPAVSKRISTLENTLGTKLFDRMGRDVRLTETGQRLLPNALKILGAMQDMRQEVSNSTGEISGVLTMGTSHHIGLRRLPGPLRSYVDAYPGVQLDIRFMGSEQICQAVEQGQLDLGVVTLPLKHYGGLERTPLWQDPLVFVAAKSHPLCQLNQPMPQDLYQHPALLPTSKTYTRMILVEALADYPGEIQVGLTSDYLETLKVMTEIGLGWSLLPETMLSDELSIIDIPDIRLERSLGIVRHRQRTLSNATQAMYSHLTQAV